MTIEFCTREYEANHGAKPRGKGSWAFIDDLHAQKENYLDFVFWAPALSTYGEAKRAAKAHFKAQADFSGIIKVLS